MIRSNSFIIIMIMMMMMIIMTTTMIMIMIMMIMIMILVTLIVTILSSSSDHKNLRTLARNQIKSIPAGILKKLRFLVLSVGDDDHN